MLRLKRKRNLPRRRTLRNNQIVHNRQGNCPANGLDNEERDPLKVSFFVFIAV